MRFVFYVDAEGFRRRVLVRDADRDSDAENIGVPADVPELAGLDVPDEARRDLHNVLTARGLFTWQDVTAQNSGITASVNAVARQYPLADASALKREVVRRYKRR